MVSANGNLSGVLSYAVEPESLTIITLDVLPGYQGLGGGKMLLEAAKDKAVVENRKAVLISASNDDLPAIYLYQKNGFRIYDVKSDVIDEHHFGFQIGFAGIPCRDEIRLRLEVGSD